MGASPWRWKNFVIQTHITTFKNPPLANSGGFFLTVAGSLNKTKPTSHMNNKNNAALDAAYIRDFDYNPETYALKALIDIYLIAGLTHYDAVLCALADYECNLQPPLQCAA